MKCEKCSQNEATIHMVRIENGVTREIYMCNSCAAESGLLTGPFSLKDMLTSFMPVQQETAPKVCSGCGSTIEDIKKTGFTGCEKCYEDLREELLPMIKAIHGSIANVGKAPQQTGSNAAASEMETLKQKLVTAIKDERYEEAAQLRDRIKVLQYNEGGVQDG